MGLFNFEGTPDAYIEFLENVVKALIEHHENCSRTRDYLCSLTDGLPLGPIRNRHNSPLALEVAGINPGQDTELKIVHYDPTPAPRPHGQLSKKRRLLPAGGSEILNEPISGQWQQRASNLIESAPRAKDWWFKLSEIKADTLEQNRWVVSCLLNAGQPLCDDIVPSMFDGSTQELIQRAHGYGELCGSRVLSTSLAVALVNFQKFILISICVVLCDLGFAVDDVNRVMRTCISNCSERHLNRLRQTAIWLNRMIDGLNARGWGNRSSELLLIWNQTPQHYLHFSYSADLTLHYFFEKLSSSEYTVPFRPKSGWIYLFVPTLVRNILGNQVNLARICQSLGYQKSEVFEPSGLVPRINPWDYFANS